MDPDTTLADRLLADLHRIHEDARDTLEIAVVARGHGKVPTDGHEEVPTPDLIHEPG